MIRKSGSRFSERSCSIKRLGRVDSKDSLLGANQIQGCFREAVLGVMNRLVLSDAAWERMAPLIIGRPDQKGSTGRDNRMFVEGVLWIVRTGSPWRDLPEAFGDWNSVFRRFSRWSIKGVWWRIFEAMIVPMPSNNLRGLCGLRRGLRKHYRNRRYHSLSRHPFNMVNLQFIRFLLAYLF